MADEWTIDTLKKWGFSSYEEVFKEHEIDKDSFFKLSDEHIRSLIPRFGPQAKFFNFWTNAVSSLEKTEKIEFPNENKIIETINAIVTVDGSLVEDVSMTNILEEKKLVDKEPGEVALQVKTSQSQKTKRSIEDSCNKNKKHISNDVKLYLEQTSEDKSYFSLYNKQSFDNSLRSELAKYIIAAELANDPNKRITPDDFRRLSEQISRIRVIG